MFTIFLALTLLAQAAQTATAAVPNAVTASQWGLIMLGISTVGGFVYGYVQKKRGNREAALAKAAFAGLKKAAVDYAEHKDLWTCVEDGIYEAAADLGVSEKHVDGHVGDGIAPPPPAPSGPPATAR